MRRPFRGCFVSSYSGRPRSLYVRDIVCIDRTRRATRRPTDDDGKRACHTEKTPVCVKKKIEQMCRGAALRRPPLSRSVNGDAGLSVDADCGGSVFDVR